MRTDDIKKLKNSGFDVIRATELPEPFSVEEAVINNKGDIEWILLCSSTDTRTRDLVIEGMLKNPKIILD